MKYSILIGLVFSTLLLGCEASGSPPEAQSLTLATTSIPVGSPTALDATVGFRDLDADLFEAETALAGEGLEEARSTIRVAGTNGIVEGDINIRLMVVAPAPGTYSLSVRLRDAEGNDSAWVSSEFQAQ